MPDYGASLTSSIYVRGLGSRMENPVLAVYIDDIPILDKNAYDFDWEGIRSASMLRGPQGTLFGRNSMCGVLSLKTFSPGAGSPQRYYIESDGFRDSRAGALFSFGNNFISAVYRHSGGYFKNAYTGKMCDTYDGGSLHWRREVSHGEVRLGNTLHVSVCDEGGFAYGRWSGGKVQPVNYNDESGYRRLSVIDGFKAGFGTGKVEIDAAASVQFLADRMRMDQDYSPDDVFTLEQRQRSGAFTGEVTARPAKEYDVWKPQTGVFVFFKWNRMNAPVGFGPDGIRTLILDNANRNIPEEMGFKLTIPEDRFTLHSDFDIASWGAALYHESVLTSGKWTLTAGLRLDYEGSCMWYDSHTALHYRLVPYHSSERPYSLSYTGKEDISAFQLVPKLSALWKTPLGNGSASLFGTFSRGFRAGGFNTQIFSDILQGKMMTGMMADMGLHLTEGAPSVTAGNTKYRPESVWNYETGVKAGFPNGISAAMGVYYMDVRNQQLTVFPPGLNTGRMMTNAGRSFSRGAEAELSYSGSRLEGRLSGSLCDARFTRFSSGEDDYSGNHIPYSPSGTFFAGVTYKLPVGTSTLSASADLRGTGKVWWNEQNSISEPFSMEAGGRLSLAIKDRYTIYLRGENILNDRHKVFYFKSFGNEFFALAKPFRFACGLSINI